MSKEIYCGEHIPVSEREKALREVIEYCEAVMDGCTSEGDLLLKSRYFAAMQIRDKVQSWIVIKKAPISEAQSKQQNQK